MSKLNWRGKEALARIRRALPDALEAAAIVVETEAEQLIVSQDIIDTGALHNNLGHLVEKDTARVGIGGGIEYAVYQEFGTRNMPARPFLRPAIDEHHADILKVFAVQIRKALS